MAGPVPLRIWKRTLGTEMLPGGYLGGSIRRDLLRAPQVVLIRPPSIR